MIYYFYLSKNVYTIIEYYLFDKIIIFNYNLNMFNNHQIHNNLFHIYIYLFHIYCKNLNLLNR